MIGNAAKIEVLKLVCENLQTAGERSVFLKMAGMGELIRSLRLQANCQEFASDLIRAIDNGAGLDIDVFIEQITKLR